MADKRDEKRRDDLQPGEVLGLAHGPAPQTDADRALRRDRPGEEGPDDVDIDDRAAEDAWKPAIPEPRGLHVRD